MWRFICVIVRAAPIPMPSEIQAIPAAHAAQAEPVQAPGFAFSAAPAYRRGKGSGCAPTPA